MRKLALLLSLGLGALLAGCDTGYKKDGPDTKARVAEASSDEMKSDSASERNIAAVAHQPQIDTSVTKLGTESSGGAVAKGVALITASDCTSCHKEKELLVGPAYAAVAQKYPNTEANVTMLANKVIQGGKGNWGEVPMTPHPSLTQADAKEMVKYILALK